MTTGMNFEQMEKKYLHIFLDLIVLTALTTTMAYVHLPGVLHVVVGVLIAVMKGLLVVLIFMHLKFDFKWLRFFILVPLFFFFAIILGTAILGL